MIPHANAEDFCRDTFYPNTVAKSVATDSQDFTIPNSDLVVTAVQTFHQRQELRRTAPHPFTSPTAQAVNSVWISVESARF
jgi:hypothetical protein